MIICICNGISEKDMKEAVTEGYCDFNDMLKGRGVCFQCYACEESAREKFESFITEAKNEAR